MVSPHDSLLVESGRVISHPAEFSLGFSCCRLVIHLFRHRRNRVRRFGTLFAWSEVERRRRVSEPVTQILKPLQIRANGCRQRETYVDRPELARSQAEASADKHELGYKLTPAPRSVSDHIVGTHLDTITASRLLHPRKHTGCVLRIQCESKNPSLCPIADQSDAFRTVTLWTISPDTRSERRFNLHITIGQLKV